MRIFRFFALLFGIALAIAAPSWAGKPSGKGSDGSSGDGSGDQPPDVGFTYDLIWLTPADGDGATCLDVNNSGVAAGFWERVGGGAFIWDPDLGIIDLNERIQSDTHYFGVARGINDNGCVVGWARLHGTDVRQPFRYYYDPANRSTDFELVDFFGSGGDMRVNNFGDIAFEGNEDQVLVFSQSGSQDPDYEPESYLVPGLSTVWGLNDNNQLLVSASSADAFSNCIRLSRISPDEDLVIRNAYANGLNNRGDIVGEFVQTRTTPSDHFRLDSDGYTILSTASGSPRAVNSFGDVCGFFGKSLSRNKLYWAPYLYHDTYGFIDVETLLPGGGDEQWKLARGYEAAVNNMIFDINDSGVILGRVKTADGRAAPYVLVPVPAQ